MTDIPALIKKNQERWDRMVLDAKRIPTFDSTAKRLTAPENKPRFQAVTSRLQLAGYQPVPWFVIAVIAEREYGGPPHWDKQLGQGDPLNQVSHHDPAGRGPFIDHPGDNNLNNAWLRCALDALIDCPPHAALWHDWTPGGALTLLEEYNGLGYAMRGVPSAYVWSGSDQYISGKYVADHIYRASAVDVQEGCAPVLKRMQLLDKSIIFAGSAGNVVVPPSHPVTVPPLGPDHPIATPVVAKGGLVQELLDAFWRL
jgi:lysozyme family protein